jgi:hypothetical protein
LGVTSAAALQMMMGLGDAQFFKKNIAHVPIIMLTGMDNPVFEAFTPFFKTSNNRGNFHEIGSCAGDNIDNLLCLISQNTSASVNGPLESSQILVCDRLAV